MTDPLAVDPIVVGVIALMAIGTMLTRVGGFWMLNRVGVSDRIEAGLSVLPGAIVVAILAPELLNGGPAEWIAAGVTAVVMARIENILVALLVGLVTVVALRSIGL